MPEAPVDLLAAVHAHAAASPQQVAFQLDRGDAEPLSLTRGGLAERIQRLGHALRAAGYGRGSKVALCMENRPAWPVAYLAVWYAGGVTVPVDPQLEGEALGRILRHSEAAACITSEALRSKVTECCRQGNGSPAVLDVDLGDGPYWDGAPGAGSPAPAGGDSISLDELVAAHPLPAGAPWSPEPAPEGLATIMYTSGTTGRPKGVMISRQALAANIRAALQRIEFTAEERVLGVLPLFHALPLLANCLGPLHLGARVVFLSELTSEAILAAFRRHGITVFVCVPLFFYRFHDRLREQLAALPPHRRLVARTLLGLCRFARRRLGLVLGRRLLAAAHRPFGPQLRLFITGGAKMNAEVHEEFLDWGFVLAQGYGLTEATAVLTATPLDDLRGDTVGPPLDGIDLRIHEPDADGTGEVWARGPSIMDGYYKDPEATSGAVVDGWLRTGDLGRLLPDGHLQITGRAKDVVVLASGKNIYPDELEEHYSQCELVGEICILGVPDPQRRGAERLHAVVVPDLEEARRRGYVNVREMIKFELETLGAQVPAPQRLTSLEVRNRPLPRTTTRKVKRYQLLQEIQAKGAEPEPAGRPAAKTVSTHGEGEPAWAAEARELVARQAKVPEVSREEHLDLDLGLESLDRVELFAQLQQRLGVRLDDPVAGQIHTVGDLLDALAARLQDGRPGEDQPEAGDQWEALLSRCPEDLGPYLKRRPVTEMVAWAALRLLRPVVAWVAGYRSDGQGRIPPDPPFLVCPNHFSYLDAILVIMGLPFRVFRRVFFVGYSEYFESWWGRLLSRWLRNIPIDPNRHLERAMQAAAEGLRRGLVLVIFPEGGRSIDGTVKDFRRGAAILARVLQVPLVPVGIWGSFQAWPRGGRPRVHPTTVVFGAPLQPAPRDAGPAADAELNGELRERVVGLVAAAERLHRPA